MKRPPQGVNRALNQGADALGVLADLFMPGLRKTLSREDEPEPERVEAQERDVIAPAEDACAMCEGAGTLTNVSGREVTCLACGGKGAR